VAEEVEDVRRTHGLAIDLEVHGAFDAMTPSQRIAILRILQEALTNAREHSGAARVAVAVTGGPDAVRLDVSDDGRGFDVERTLVRAARRGRLGLVGMAERVRLLGGTFDVRSQPGGPTTSGVALPEWHDPEESQPD
jgi:signal transduction histidine kinase